jgi:hypothetical protein
MGEARGVAEFVAFVVYSDCQNTFPNKNRSAETPALD